MWVLTMYSDVLLGLSALNSDYVTKPCVIFVNAKLFTEVNNLRNHSTNVFPHVHYSSTTINN